MSFVKKPSSTRIFELVYETLDNVVKHCSVVDMARPQGQTLSVDAWNDILELRGMTLTEVADRAEIPRSTMSSLLGGFHRASLPMTHRIAAAAGCRVRTLFPGLGTDKATE